MLVVLITPLQDMLLRRSRYFFPGGGRNHLQYSLCLYHGGMSGIVAERRSLKLTGELSLYHARPWVTTYVGKPSAIRSVN